MKKYKKSELKVENCYRCLISGLTVFIVYKQEGTYTTIQATSYNPVNGLFNFDHPVYDYSLMNIE